MSLFHEVIALFALNHVVLIDVIIFAFAGPRRGLITLAARLFLGNIAG